MRISTLLILLLLFAACDSEDNSPEEMADDLCNCMMEEGLTNHSIFTNGDDFLDPDTSPECAKDISKRLAAKLKEMTQGEKVTFTRDFLKAVIDTDCGSLILHLIPFEPIIRDLDKINELKEKTDTIQ